MREMRDAFFDPLVKEALVNKDIIILAADHTAMSLELMKNQIPEQFINVGISEQNMISVAAGLALRGKKVFAYGINPFVSLKVLEQATLDVAAQKLDVNIVGVGAGFAYSTDGPSHHGLQDVGCMLSVPQMEIWNCSDPATSEMIARVAINQNGPRYIRIEKGALPTLGRVTERDFRCSEIRHGGDLSILTTGSIIHDVLESAQMLEDRYGVSASVIDLCQIKPLPKDMLCKMLVRAPNLVTVEEGLIGSGFCNLVAAMMLEQGIYKKFMRIGVGDQFCYEYGSRDLVKTRMQLDAESITRKISSWMV